MSRFDAIGMFWEDIPSTKKGGKVDRPMPAIPEEATWRPPTYLPNIKDAAMIAIDLETYDPELLEHGPGWARGVGHIIGVAIGAWHPKWGYASWYFPIRHETEAGDNWDPDVVLNWCREVLADPKQPKVGANLTYDVGWFKQEGVEVKGPLLDVQFGEALLDEAAPVALEDLGQKYLNLGKESSLLYDWLSKWKGGKPNGSQRKWLYVTPPRMVGPYAESDVDLPLRIIQLMWPLLQEQGLLTVFQMECDLIPLMIEMRFEGVSVDLDAAEQLRGTLDERSQLFQKRIKDLVGFNVNVNAGDSLAKAFKQEGLKYNLTAKGKPSFTKAFLEGVNHPLGEYIREIRKCEKLKGTFVESYILDSHVNGKVYGQFHQLRGDGGGTRSGRFSSSNPNLQNIPSRDEELAPLVRGLFIPDQGHLDWIKIDYDQVEYRFLAHYAIGGKSEDLRAILNADPNTDYHNIVLEMVAPVAGWDISTKEGLKHWRKPIKNINFGLIYGMGVATLAAGLKMKKQEAQNLSNTYHQAAPYVQATMDESMELAQSQGYVTTILGRRSRFDLWEPAKWGRDVHPLPLDQAIVRYGGKIKRAMSHKALNRRLQGGAADYMKMAMLKCYQDGVFDEIGVPRLTVHDELNFSRRDDSNAEAWREMQHIMQNAIPMRVPITASPEHGPNWGRVKDITF
ncbi:DNA polymerase A [Vibrio phage VpKK5]|uniref:DNA polymerase A n=1 Tax=Vibrio phage VpKK5 TaxID=1538804 RepID=UPI0004F81DE4|nr:DNA polymerase A [Vibrio phage VpKK5]AIM40620.1 DNA polymerase A [Vibrio phage VpKK5]